MGYFVILAILTLLATAKAMTPFQLRLRVSKAQCDPVKGLEKEILPCYDFNVLELVDPENCDSYPHCCEHNCKCILRGAGAAKGQIPLDYQLKSLRTTASKKKALKKSEIKACIDKSRKEKGASSERTREYKEANPDNEESNSKEKKKTCAPASTQKPLFAALFFGRLSSLLEEKGIESTVVNNC